MSSMSIKLIRFAVLGSLLAICLAPSAFADSTYSYQGPAFTIFNGSDSCISGVGECAIAFSITLSQPLGDNFDNGNGVTPIAFTLSDGTNVLTNGGPGVVPIEFFFMTNSSGAIVQWNVDVANANAELFTHFFGGSGSDNGACGSDGDATSGGGGCAGTPAGVVGSWSGPTTATSEPSSVLLFGFGLIGFALLSFKRATA